VVVRSESDDEDLLAAAATGDARAFELFYRRWLGPVMSYHLRATGSRELALDLAAETFAAVVASVPKFDRTRGNASAWLFSIARHKLQDSLRRTRVGATARSALGWQRVAVTDEDLERVGELASQGEGVLGRLLAELPAEQREALHQRVLEERPYAEIAAEMECSEMLVRQRVHRALRHIRRSLEEPA
jgi:RNA polymerase sigma factor (sigma-70 family)